MQVQQCCTKSQAAADAAVAKLLLALQLLLPDQPLLASGITSQLCSNRACGSGGAAAHHTTRSKQTAAQLQGSVQGRQQEAGQMMHTVQLHDSDGSANTRGMLSSSALRGCDGMATKCCLPFVIFLTAASAWQTMNLALQMPVACRCHS